MTDTKTRLKALRARMAASGTGLVALAPGTHMHWVLGFHPYPDERPCLLLVGPSREAVLMPALNAQGARESTDMKFFEWADADGPAAALDAALAHVNASGDILVALDEGMRADFALLLLAALPRARPAYTDATVGWLRMRKEAAEYAALKENAAINDHAMQAAFTAIRPGISESDLAAVVRAAFADRGARTEFAIIGAGPNGAYPHHETGGRKLAQGDAVVIDIGGRKGDFPSDMTRMAVVGTAPEGYAEIHAIVERAVQAALAAARPGVKARDVDNAARSVITDAGYGEFFVHRTGHGLGLDIHEQPYITGTSETVLDEGMVFSIEPGIYLPGRFGIRLEDIVILRKDGPEILSALPRQVYMGAV